MDSKFVHNFINETKNLFIAGQRVKANPWKNFSSEVMGNKKLATQNVNRQKMLIACVQNILGASSRCWIVPVLKLTNLASL